MMLLCVRFAYLQLVDPEDYRTKALDQLTSTVTLEAKRGAIYASDGTTELAVSATVYNCFISPYDIEDNVQLNEIANGLSAILGVDRATVVEKGSKTSSKYQVIKKFLSDEEETAIRSYIKENSGFERVIHLEETTKRYYRYGNLACHLLGFTGSDNAGLAGLEYSYDEYLSGIDGKSVKAQDAYGNELDSEYSTYIPAVDGYSIVTTIDWTIQSVVEKYLRQAYDENMPKGRAECIVMDVSNGEILASAVYPSYDPNEYNELSEHYQSIYDAFTGTQEERSAYRQELLFEMWNNAIATMPYEPGSTFKIITSAMALEEGVVTPTGSSFNCGGEIKVAGTTIHCHNTHGHGTQTFSEALVNSCNPAFIQTGLAVGATTFKTYFEEFGYTTVSGSDIIGEANPIYYDTYGTQFESIELAVYSFGQTFKITPIQHIRAVSAVANGGYLVVPHAVKALVDNDGNTVKTFAYDNDRQVISKQTCDSILSILTNSTKNACVNGYNIVAKTGTSEKRDTEAADYISSCVAFAPAEDPQIAILVLVDDPTAGQHFGSAVAAPVVSNVLAEVLPHLGISPNTSEDEKITVENYIGMYVSEAADSIESTYGFKVITKGGGEIVTGQMPEAGALIDGDGVIILYTEGETAENSVKVPNLIGNSPTTAIRSLINSNLNVSISGIFNDDYTNCRVVAQSVEAGQYVAPGTVIELEFLYEEEIE